MTRGYRLYARPMYVRPRYRVRLTDVIVLSVMAIVVWMAKLTWWFLVGVYLFYKWAAIWAYRGVCELHRRYVTRSRGQIPS